MFFHFFQIFQCTSIFKYTFNKKLNKLLPDNSLKVQQYYLNFGRLYHIYFVFIPTFENLRVFHKIYSLYVFFSCSRSKLMN